MSNNQRLKTTASIVAKLGFSRWSDRSEVASF